jgi:glutathione S-transferase
MSALPGGRFLFGERPTLADAMYAPVCTRFVTYDVALSPACARYRDRTVAWPVLMDWIRAALSEPEEIEEIDMEF